MQEKQPQQSQLEGMSHYTPEVVRENYERNRIVADESFSGLYSEYVKDMERVKALHQTYENKDGGKEGLGFDAEALVFTCIEKGALGNNITARGTSLYDDYYHGADLIIESRAQQVRDPIISAVDVTINQKNIHTNSNEYFKTTENDKVGFEKKLDRVKKHINLLANLSDNEAVELSAWLQSGGLTRERNRFSESKFRRAEELMLLKYYKNPKHGDNPDLPHFVASGPQIVASIDTLFINKVFSTSNDEVLHNKAVDILASILQAEVPLSVVMLNDYVEKVANSSRLRGLGTNLFFASYRAACKAWEETFSSDQYQMRMKRAIQTCNQDREAKRQLQDFMNTLQKSFDLK